MVQETQKTSSAFSGLASKYWAAMAFRGLSDEEPDEAGIPGSDGDLGPDQFEEGLDKGDGEGEEVE